jgi:predicted chitinase
LNIDLINNPELAAFPSVAGKIAARYWRKKNLNAYSDGTFYSFSKQTKIINGGLLSFVVELKNFEYLIKHYI